MIFHFQEVIGVDIVEENIQEPLVGQRWARVAPQSKVNEFCGCWGWDNTNLLDEMITPNIGPKSVLGILRGTHPRMRGGTQSRTPSQTLNSWRGTEWRMWRDMPQAWVSKFHRIGFGLPDIHISTTWAWICWMLWRGNLQQTDSKCIYSKGFSRIFLVSGNQHGNWKPSVLIKTSMDRVRDFSLKTQYITIFHK